MNEHIRRFEDRAERLALDIDALAQRPDITRIALAGVFGAAAIGWFAIAWGEGWLLLTLPVLVGGCIWSARARANRPDPSLDPSELADSSELQEIDARLARLTATPARAEVPSFSTPPIAEPAEEPKMQDQPLLEAPAAEPALTEVSAQVMAAVPTPATSLDLFSLHSPSLEPPRLDPPPAAPEPEPSHEAEQTPALTLYEVREIRAGAPVLLEVRATFDAAVDIAFELIQERDPAELDIVAVRGHERETAWIYSRDAAGSAKPQMVELFGFDVTRWSGRR